MEPPRGFRASLWNFICFLPYFIGLLILGFIKGIILCPLICLIMGIGNSGIILGLWPVHIIWTNYSILRAKRFVPLLKIVICLFISPILILWPVFGILGSIISGAAYGLLAPMFATFKAVGEGKTNEFFHCLYDGTVDTVKESFTVVRDVWDVCFHSYFSAMDDLQHQGPGDVKYFEIRLLYLPGALLLGLLGFLVDFPVISLIAICKSPYMLFKGWHRLFHDCIGREGPFLETICVPFAGLAILLWPLAVAGAVLGSMLSSIFLGAYAAVVVYQESSLWFGLCYIVASLSIYDEYSNDVLDMPEGSCFPRPQYQKNVVSSETSSRAASFSRPDSFRNPPSRTASMKYPMVELKALELLDSFFKECQQQGEVMVSQGLITLKDIEDAKSFKDSGIVISIGLPAYVFLQTLLRSAKANSAGILLNDNVTEITSTNRPKDAFFDWFFQPLLIIKDQIKAENLFEAEEDYLGKLVMFSGDPERMKNPNIGPPPESERKRAELDALARRLRGITKSISRYPTFRRRFEDSIKMMSEELAKKNGIKSTSNGQQNFPRSRSTFARIFSQRSFRSRTSNRGSYRQESQSVSERREVENV
ncbi:hypothetical protein CsSME_00004958 [Camellia sinensis var. sinensis]|uniref:Uncharacterized protein n=1 Tax=Camellia sinensis TaxID=4442 RepID=A0A7J7I302_CAMSI|nr:hypothetical protein HYC85_006061 [Camellia sinensis]